MKTIETITIRTVFVLSLLSGWSNSNNNDAKFGMKLVDSFTILSTHSLSSLTTKRQTTTTTTTCVVTNSNCYINPMFLANRMLSQISTISSRHSSFLVLSSTKSNSNSDSNTNNHINNRQQQKQQQQHTSRRDILLQTVATTTSLLIIPAATPDTATAAALTTKDIMLSKAVCDPTVSVWTIQVPIIEPNDLSKSATSGAATVPKFDNRIVYILGTAHISEVSAELAGRLVQDTHPNAVFVELDIKRLASSLRSSALSTSTTDGSTTSTVTQGGTGSNVLTAETTTGSTSRIVIPVLPSNVSTRKGNGMGTTSSNTNVASVQSSSDIADNNQSSSSGMVPTSSTNLKASSNNSNGLLGNVQKSIMNYATVAVGNAIRGMYKNLNTAGFNPGEEFIVAINEGQKINADIVLGDQDVEITLSRLTTALSQTNINKLLNDKQLEQTMSQLVPGTSSSSGTTSSTLGFTTNDINNNISKEEIDILYKKELTDYIETIKSRDNVRTIMSQLQQVAPELVSVMLTERDIYMATCIDIINQYQCIVAIVGIAHMDGIETNLINYGWNQIPIQTTKQCTSILTNK